MTTNQFRLLSTVKPSRYRLELSPDLNDASFLGCVEIEISIGIPISLIKVNSAELAISSAVLSKDSQKYECTITYDVENEMALLALATEVDAGLATLTINFTGVLNDQLAGFYRSSYVDENGDTQHLACTQFEATDARKAFPCFDEPDLKAIFEVSLIVDEKYFTVSNGAEISRIPQGDGKIRVNFEPTIVMSTYLLAFIVGDLVATPTRVVRGTPVRIIHRPGWDKLTQFAFKATEHALEFLTDYFEIPYPGTKLDLIAIPDFAAGAMENLGAITFREALLLVDENSASQPEKERIVDVVSHEIAHMWFGDLVTMKWWNGIWLNEAFATYMETLTTDHFDPDWGKWNSFGIYRATAQATDALHSTRPIEFEVERPADCNAMFDILTYEKGGSVLRMLERHLGYERFRKGIIHYLNKYLFSNAETTDLWDAIEEETQEPVRAMMDTWVFQGGFPLVYLEKSNEKLRATQTPFFYSTERPNDSAIGTSWLIPLALRSVEDRSQTTNVLLGPDPTEINWSSNQIVVGNAFGDGYYRVKYAPELLNGILNSFNKLVELERFNIISDAWAMVVANQSSFEEFIQIANAYSNGLYKEPAGWAIIGQGIEAKAKALGPNYNSEAIRLASQIYQNMYELLGDEPVEGEQDIIGVLRSNVIGILGTLIRDPHAITMARQAFRAEISRESPLEPSLASALLHTVACNGDESDYAFILDRFKHPISPVDEQRFLDALSSFEQPPLIDRTLAMTLDTFRSQDGPFVINKMLRKPACAAKTFDFVVANYDALREKFPKSSITRMLDGMSGLFGPEMTARAAEVRGFLASVDVPEAGKTLAQIKERYEANLLLGNRLRRA